MKLRVLASLILLFILTSCGHTKTKIQEDITNNDNAYFEETYSLDFNDEELSFVILNYDEFNDITKSENDFIVSATRDDCDYCHKIMPKYISVMTELDISKIYFVDTKSLTQEEKDDMRDKHGIDVVPTTIINFEDGSKEVIYGDTDESTLRTTFSKIKGGI